MGGWNRFLLGKTKENYVPCEFCGGAAGDGHLFWECPFPPFVQDRDHPEFSALLRCDRSSWPRCLVWHGWLPALTPRRVHPTWAVAIADTVDAALECALGRYPVSLGEAWDAGWDPKT